MDQGTEPIRQDIDAIRDSMTDKLEQIETKIKGTVEDTKRMVDIKYQVSQRPWVALGTSVLIGYALGSLGGSTSASPSHSGTAFQYDSHPIDNRYRPAEANGDSYRYASTSYGQEARRSSEPGMIDQIKDQFGGEIETLKAAAVTSLISLVRDAVKQNLPAVHQEMQRLRGEQGMPSTNPMSRSYDTTAASTASRYYDSADTTARERAVGETNRYS